MPFTRVTAFLWLIACWFFPALLAQRLRWDAVWGGDRVFADYAMPFPIAGGFFHVMTLFLAIGIVGVGVHLKEPWRRLTPAALVAFAGVGSSLLFDVGRWYLERTTDLPDSGLRLQENPLGLFFVNDAVFGFIWLVGRADVWPRTGATIAGSLALALVPPFAAGSLIASQNPQVRSSFVHGTSIPGLARGDAAHTMFTRMSVTDPGFREAAVRELAPYRPGGDVSDRAVYFLTSLEAARSARDGFGASVTYCMYDDGTPPAWHEGYGDCFSGHDTVEDRRHAAFERLRRERVPEEVAAYLSGREMCALPDARPERRASCEVDQTTRVRELLASHGADPAVRARLEAVLTAPPG